MTPWNVCSQAPLSMEFSRQEYWSGTSWRMGASSKKNQPPVSELELLLPLRPPEGAKGQTTEFSHQRPVILSIMPIWWGLHKTPKEESSRASGSGNTWWWWESGICLERVEALCLPYSSLPYGCFIVMFFYWKKKKKQNWSLVSETFS